MPKQETGVVYFQGYPIRYRAEGSKVWMVGKDVCLALGYKDYNGKLKGLPRCAKIMKTSAASEDYSGTYRMTHVSMGGLKLLTRASCKESAEQFSEWLTRWKQYTNKRPTTARGVQQIKTEHGALRAFVRGIVSGSIQTDADGADSFLAELGY